MEFYHIGTHCALTQCKQRDFLPFKCDGCSLEYCLAHREYKSHDCKSAPQGVQVLTCPICLKGIPFDSHQDANMLWQIHYTQNCKKEVKLACANKACKKLISEVNSITCNDCNKLVCLQHRFNDQHPCKDPGKNKTLLNGHGCKCKIF